MPLPSALGPTLGKIGARAPRRCAGRGLDWRCYSLSCVQRQTIGKVLDLPSVLCRYSAKCLICRVPMSSLGTRQSSVCRVPGVQHSANKISCFFLNSKFFLLYSDLKSYFPVIYDIFIILFTIFHHFFVWGKLSIEVKLELEMGWNFEIIERKSNIRVIESKLMSYLGKDFKFETSW